MHQADQSDLLSLFPAGSGLAGDGMLVVGGCRADDPAAAFGTPVLVVAEDALRSRAREYRDELSARWPDSRVVFASKAFPCTAVQRVMVEEGLGLDVAGGGEILTALKAGADPGLIVLHGNAKSDEEIALAVEHGIGLVVVDNADDVDRLEATHCSQDVLVRIIPGVTADTHSHVLTGHEGSKFGLAPPDAARLIQRIERGPRLRMRGLHVHVGSQILDVEPFAESVAPLARLGEFEVYDLGGGLGARYTWSDEPPTVAAYLDALIGAAKQHLPASAHLIIEPGRSMVCTAATTIYRVTTVKRGAITFVAVDGGMGDNLEVIYQVTYDDHVNGRSTTRDIAYRMSFAEMVVPYRDPSFDHYRRTAFDIGEWGLGFMTTSLELGCDCLGEIVYLDAVLHDTLGEPVTIKNAICLHEEDNAVLWKHVDHTTGAEVRRMRRMVVSCHATVANYEYLIYWRFSTDGNIECEVRATGLMVTTPFAADGTPPATGTVVDKQTYAPFHQHFLVARLDLDVDGDANTVQEVDSRALPVSDDNPYGLAVVTEATPIRSESEAARDFNWAAQRAWKVVNPNRVNAVGTNPAYKLIPSASIPPLMDPGTPQYLRAPVIGHTVWVTRQHDEERWPCGDYPTQSTVDDGMTRWIADDEPLENTDVVLWYVFGIHHVIRVEDWPVMPVDTIAFWLKPFGFFDRNPALDVADSSEHQHEG